MVFPAEGRPVVNCCQAGGPAIADDVLQSILDNAREDHPERAWKESVIVAAFRIRWGVAIAVASLSAVVAIAALALILSPVFNESTDSFVRVALTGAAPVMAILAVTTAVDASSKVLRAP